MGVGVFADGIHWGTFAAGGCDSYCYVHQADAWASGHLQVVEPLALEAPWPDPPLTFAPAGHIPSPTVRGAAVPICPAGLSIVLAPFVWAAGAGGAPDAVVLVVPLFGALLVWSVYLLGTRFSPIAGIASACLVACSPAFLFQLMQPMSDVPAAALWVLAAVFATSDRPRAPLLAGLATSAAILMRPNLLPMGVVLGAYFLVGSDPGDGATRGVASRRHRRRHGGLTPALVFAAASAPGCFAVALIQQMFYGSPWRSGYGALNGLFALNRLAENATRYATWMTGSHTPIWLLALAAPFMLRARRLVALLLSLALVNVLCYLPYAVFNDWWYLRFLLPGIAMVMVVMIATFEDLVVRLAHVAPRKGAPYTAVLCTAVFTIALALLFIREARARNVFDLQRLESRYVRAGVYVADHLPPNALIIASWESGSVRLYGHRNTPVWDVLDPAWL